jgi:phage shock protein C
MDQMNGYTGKKLYRSQMNKMLGGVCGGFAEYFNIDPTLVRMIWITLFLLGGVGVLVYLAALVIIPVNPEQEPGEEGPEKLIQDK